MSFIRPAEEEEEVPIRRSCRLEERRWASIGAFRRLPLEIIHHILSFLRGKSLAQLARASKGWQLTLQAWLELASTGWTIAPARRFAYHSGEFYGEYADLGLMCRRVYLARSLAERAHSFWGVIVRLEMASVRHDLVNYEPGFQGAANFFRAAVPLNCGTPGERFDAMWGVIQDSIAVGRSLLDGEPGGARVVLETDVRLALRVVFLAPPDRDARPDLCWGSASDNARRARMMRSLMCKLSLKQQARLLFICYGPRTGPAASIDWTKPSDPEFHSLAAMAHVVAELGSTIEVLARQSSPTYMYSLIKQLLATPSPWLPRYEVMLLLMMGPCAAAMYLAGVAARRRTRSPFVPTRIAQMASLSQLYQQKIVAGEIWSSPVLMAASVNFHALFVHLFRFLPEDYTFHSELVDEAVSIAFAMGATVGGADFASRVILHFASVIDEFQHFWK